MQLPQPPNVGGGWFRPIWWISWQGQESTGCCVGIEESGWRVRLSSHEVGCLTGAPPYFNLYNFFILSPCRPALFLQRIYRIKTNILPYFTFGPITTNKKKHVTLITRGYWLADAFIIRVSWNGFWKKHNEEQHHAKGHLEQHSDNKLM